MSRKRKDCKDTESLGDINLDQFLNNLNEHMSSPDNGFEDSGPLEKTLRKLRYEATEWEKYSLFSEEHYTRNLVATKDFTFDLLILCWQPGHKSAVHDHRESGCWMRMLKGQLTETRYKVADTKSQGSPCERGEDGFALNEEHLVKLSDRTYQAGDVFYINNNLGLHSVHNPGKEQAISLHLYSPPIMDCEVWLENGPQMFKTSVHSIFGMRLPQHMFKPKPSKGLGGKYWPLAVDRSERKPEKLTKAIESNKKKLKTDRSELNSSS